MPNFRYDVPVLIQIVAASCNPIAHACFFAQGKADEKFIRQHLQIRKVPMLKTRKVQTLGRGLRSTRLARGGRRIWVNTALRPVRTKVSSQQFLIFRLSTLSELRCRK